MVLGSSPVAGTISITRTGADPALRNADKINKQVTFKNCVSFTDWIIKINNTKLDNAKDLKAAMPMYNLIE